MKSKEKRRDVPLLTKAEEDAVIARAVRGEAAAMAEMTARYRGLITAESHASYLRGSALAAEAENVAVLAFIEALHDYDAAYGPPFAGFVKARVHHALIAEFRRELRRRARTCAPQEDAAGHEAWAACGTVCPTERAEAAPRRGYPHARDAPPHGAGEGGTRPPLLSRPHPAPHCSAPRHERGGALQEQGKSPAKTARLCGTSSCNST